MSEVILLLYMTNLIPLFTDIKNIKRWWPNNDFPLYDKTTLLRMCGLMCKRNGMPKDYGVVNWPYRAHILFMQKRMLDTNVNSMLKEVRVLYSLRKIRINKLFHSSISNQTHMPLSSVEKGIFDDVGFNEILYIIIYWLWRKMLTFYVRYC